MAVRIGMLRALVAVADRGDLSSAREALGRTPSALSMTLRQIEEEVGAPPSRLCASRGRRRSARSCSRRRAGWWRASTGPRAMQVGHAPEGGTRIGTVVSAAEFADDKAPDRGRARGEWSPLRRQAAREAA